MKAIVCVASSVLFLTTFGTAFGDDFEQKRQYAYDTCYKRIEAQFGPYTDINWMRKVWDCAETFYEPKAADTAEIKASVKECDFEQPVSGCRGTIKVESTKGSKGSYSAEIIVSSSAPACSKVEFYLDNTPHQTVLKLTSSAQESVFGTNPISRKNFEVFKCTTYATQ